jgi:hypothetical protein
LPFPLGIVLGLVLIWFGVRALYRQVVPKSASPSPGVVAALLCKIYPHGLAAIENPTTGQTIPGDDFTLLSGATLKLNAPPKATIDDTVVVDLCVETPSTIPQARRQALLSHLLVQLSAVGLQIDPHDKVAPVLASGPCVGTAAWTVRANAPGTYTAILLPDSIDHQPNRPSSTQPKPQWDFALDQPAQLRIQFQPEWTDYVQKSWGAVSTVLGTLLVFTQVIINLRQRKKTA